MLIIQLLNTIAIFNVSPLKYCSGLERAGRKQGNFTRLRFSLFGGVLACQTVV
jgi:hypothetical protein